MINKLKPKSDLSRNVLTLMTGTSIAQAIPIAISPILTRIYTPEDFGIFALYMSISAMIAVVVTGRYELAIMLPKKDTDALNIVALSILIAFFVSFVVFLIVLVYNKQITEILETPGISNWLYFIPLTILLTGVYQSFNYWSNRKKKYKKISISRVIQSGITSSSNLSLGMAGIGASGLLFSSVLGQFVSTYSLASIAWREDKHLLVNIKKLKIYALLRKYIVFLKINVLHAFLNEFKNFLLSVFFVKLYDSFILGQFYMVNKVLLLPSSLIGSSISQVYYKIISEKYNNGEDFSKDVLGLMIKLFLFGFIPFLIIVLFGKTIFIFIFGENWKIGGELASSYALYIWFHFVASPISIVPLVVEKQEVAFYWNLAGVILYLSSIGIGYYLFRDLSQTFVLLSGVMAVFFTINFIWIYDISKITKQRIRI